MSSAMRPDKPAKIPPIDEKILKINAWTAVHREVRITLSYVHDSAMVAVNHPGKETEFYYGRNWHDCLDWVIKEYVNADQTQNQKHP